MHLNRKITSVPHINLNQRDFYSQPKDTWKEGIAWRIKMSGQVSSGVIFAPRL